MFPVGPGDPLKISASDYNAAVEAGRQWMRQRRLGVGGQVNTPPINHGLIWIRNSTSGSLSRGAVVELSTPIVDTLTPRVLWLDGIVRAGVGPACAVVLDPVEQLGVVPALVSGVCLADVNIIDSDNTHARVVPGSTQLRGDFGGWARILYKPSGTGVKTCVVQVGETRTVRRKAKATTTITKAGTGSADVYVEGSVRGNVTVSYNWLTGPNNIATGTELFIDYYHDEDKWIVADIPVTSGPEIWTQMISSNNVNTWWFWQDGAASRDTDAIELTANGVFCFPRFGIGTYSNANGAVIGLRTTPTAHNDTAITFSQNAFFALHITTIWSMPPLSSSVWNSNFRTESHDHTVVVPVGGTTYTTSSVQTDSVKRDSLRGVTILTTVNGVNAGYSSMPYFYTGATGTTDRYATHTRQLPIDRSSSLTGLTIKVARLSGEFDDLGSPVLAGMSVHLQQCSNIL